MYAHGIRTMPKIAAPMEPIKPMTKGGAPNSLKNGDSKENTSANVKYTNSQLIIRVSKLPRINENSFLIFERLFSGIFNSYSVAMGIID